MAVQLLIVDSDVEAAKKLSEGLRAAGYQIALAQTSHEVWSHLGNSRPDLILSETQLPDASGFELLRELRQRDEFAHLPFVFLATENSIDSKIHGLELQADDYIQKSSSAHDVIEAIGHVLERRRHEKLNSELHRAEDSISGSLEGTSVTTLLRRIEASGKAGVLTLSTRHYRGVIYFRAGRLIDATVAELRGEEAVFRLLLCHQGSYLIQFRNVRRSDRISIPTEALLAEGLRYSQRWQELEAKLPNLETVVTLETDMLARTLGVLPDHANHSLKLIDGQRSLLKIIDDSPDDGLTVLELLATLYQDGLLRVVQPVEMASAPFSGEKTLGWFPAAMPPIPPASGLSTSDSAPAMYQDTELDALTPSEGFIPVLHPLTDIQMPAALSDANPVDSQVDPPARPPLRKRSHRGAAPRSFPMPFKLQRAMPMPIPSAPQDAAQEPGPVRARQVSWPIYVFALSCVGLGLGLWLWSQPLLSVLPEQGYLKKRALDAEAASSTARTTQAPPTPMEEPAASAPAKTPAMADPAEVTQDPAPSSGDPAPLATQAPATTDDGAYQKLVKDAKRLRYQNTNRAIELYTQALAINANDTAVLGDLALLYYTKRDYPRAIDFAARAVTNDATNAEAWLALGASRQAEGDKSGAQEAYRLCSEHGVGPMVTECRRMLR